MELEKGIWKQKCNLEDILKISFVFWSLCLSECFGMFIGYLCSFDRNMDGL